MISLITSNTHLASACTQWSTKPALGLDTEFFRERTYYPCPALIQVADDDAVALVDPLAVSDFTPLDRLLANEAVGILMHSCGEDLEVFERLFPSRPTRIFDTQLAAAFAGHGFSLGYSTLVTTLLGVEVDKGETRSDWLRRPLSESQQRYAELDVTYLAPMHDRLSRELEALGRLAWVEQEFEHRRSCREVDRQPEAAYLKVPGRGALAPPDHAVLRALAAWRETEVQARDMPRRHLIGDDVLVRLARVQTPALESLRGVTSLSPRARTRYGEVIAACIDTARAAGPDPMDTPTNLRPHAATLRRLKAAVQLEAETQAVPPGLLANRRALESLVVSSVTGADMPAEFRGWRSEVITDALLACL
jgi:ribonuclease D